MGRKPSNRESPRYKARVGYEGEYSLLRKFVDAGEAGYYAVRTPGSGSGKMPKPDIIAVDHGELMAIEVKSSGKDYAMFSRDQVLRLLEFVKRFEVCCPHCKNRFNPRPIAAVRFIGRGWRFVDLSPFDGRGLVVRWEDDGRGS
jgi:Holliday junction resolvase